VQSSAPKPILSDLPRVGSGAGQDFGVILNAAYEAQI